MTDTLKPSPARKLVLWTMAGLLVIIFLSSVVFRLDNPSIRVQNRQAQQTQMPPQGMMGQNGDMGAIGQLMQKMRDNPDDAEVLTELGHRLMMMGDSANAEIFLARALAQNPTNSTLIHMMGVNLHQMERYEESAEQFDLLLAIDPNNANAHYNLGMLYKHYLNRAAEAPAHFQAVLDAPDVNPDLAERARKELEGDAPEGQAEQQAQ